METVIRTDGLPAGEGFALWRDTVGQMLVPMEIRSERADDFASEIRACDLGATQVAWLRYAPLEAYRTAALIRRSDPEFYFLAFSIRGHGDVTQNRRTAALGPGDLTLYSSSRPYHTLTPGEGFPPYGKGILAIIPHAALPLPGNKLDQLLATRLSVGTGLVPLVSSYLLELTRGTSRYGPADMIRLATVTLDLITAMLAERLDAGRSLPPDTRQGALLARICAFIQKHLADPALTPDVIAAAHHISRRYLYKLFASSGSTVAGWIRASRLERIRRDLADPLLHHQPVHTIAARWGMTDAAHFSRLFKAAHGVTPLSYRLQHTPSGRARMSNAGAPTDNVRQRHDRHTGSG